MTVQQTFALALRQHQAGHLAEAEVLYRQILDVEPNHAEALHLLGVTAYQAGRYDSAIELIGLAVSLHPGNPVAHTNLGEAYRAMARRAEAIVSHQRAIELRPTYAEAHNNLGIALMEEGRYDQAVEAFSRAIETRADFAEAYNGLGNALREQGQGDEAVAAYRRGLQIRPDFPQLHNNLGVALAGQDHFAEAVAAYRRALELRPDYVGARTNLGLALARLGQLDEATAAHRQALWSMPDSAEIHNNLGNALKDQGQLEEAIGMYRRGLQLKPGDASLRSNLIYALHLQSGVDEETIALEYERWNQQFSHPVKQSIRLHTNDRSPGRRLRIGYVSPDFRDHVVGRNILPLFRNHDQRTFEILCYAGVADADEWTDEFRRLAGRWRSTLGWKDEALAEQIRQDGVDILVDLAQHTAGNRLPMFAHRPAPVQVSFAGYPASAGIEAIARRISDAYLEKGNAASRIHSNEQVYLIDSFWSYDPCGMEIEANALPAEKSGRVTFGSLNSFSKVNEPLLKLWTRVMREVKDARLLMLSGFGSHRERTLELLGREGVEPRQVEFVEPRARRAYLELYHQVDMVLDTFPYNGHTTGLDALWMGVPVVSLAGARAVSRAGFSQLSNLGLRELVAFSEEEYVEIAVRLAHDLPRLAELRRTLRARMEASVLMDAERFTRGIEAAYRKMWRQWCDQDE